MNYRAPKSEPIPAFMHPDTARRLLALSRARRMLALAQREADRANERSFTGGK
jgi:hypothetical protein